MGKDLQIRINIPFCSKKCSYCSLKVYDDTPFINSHTQKKEHALLYRNDYLSALQSEFTSVLPDLAEYIVRSILITGGTPTMCDGLKLARFIKCLENDLDIAEDIEITLQTNPGTISADALDALKAVGVKRFGFCVGSMNVIEWNFLMRPVSMGAVDESLLLFSYHNLDNYSLELLYGIPGQTVTTLKDSIRNVDRRYHPVEIVLDRLVPTPGTPLFRAFVEGLDVRGLKTRGKILPSKTEIDRMETEGAAYLEKLGYHRYAPGHFAKRGRESLRVILEQRDMEFLSLGLGGISRLDGFQTVTTDNLYRYIEGAGDPSDIIIDAKEIDL